LNRGQLYSRLDKSIIELLEVLGDIDENDTPNASNEWSIDDNNGGRITLNYDPKTKNLTISKGCLNLMIRVN
jgi:hypothetical protein